MLKFLGTGSAFNPEFGNNSAYIKHENTLLLLDCGESVFARLKDGKILDDVKNVYIVITHMHSDHIGSLGTLILYLNYIKEIYPNIILSNGDESEQQEKELTSYLASVGVSEDCFDYTYGDMVEDILPDLQHIDMHIVNHTKSLNLCFAVDLVFKNKTIYYSGDNNDLDYYKQISKVLKENDVLYTDCSLYNNPNSAHVYLLNLNKIFSDKQKKQIYCMHFDNYETIKEAKNLGFNVATKQQFISELLKNLLNKN